MIKFLTLTVRNFMMYGNFPTTFNLDRSETVLICGENGTGKTSIIDALTFAVYGKPLSGIQLGNLINNINNKDMEVSVLFEIKGTYYSIKRTRKNKTSGGVQFFVKKGSTEFTPDDDRTRGIDKTNEDIERAIGIPYELFSRIVVFSALHRPFLDLPSRHASQASQASIIEELFGLTMLTHKAEVLKKQIKDNKQLVEVEQVKIDQQTQEEERYTKQVEQAKERITQWESSNSNSIDQIKAHLKILEGINVEEQEEAYVNLSDIVSEIREVERYEEQLGTVLNRKNSWEKEKKSNIKTIESKLSKVADIDIEDQQRAYAEYGNLDTEINTLKTQLQQSKGDAGKYDVAIREKEKELVELQDNKCPRCKQEYPDARTEIKEITKQLKKWNEEATAINTRVNELTDNLKTLQEKQSEVRERITVTNLGELLEIKSQTGALEESLETIKQSTNPYIDEYNTLLVKSPDISLGDLEKAMGIIQKNITVKSVNELQEIKTDIEIKKSRLSKLEIEPNPYWDVLKDLEESKPNPVSYTKVNHLKNVLDHQDFLLKLLTKKDSFVRKILINKNIPYLNHRLQKHLNDIRLPHLVEFTPELSARISKFGRELDFGNLSSGQKSRVNIALSFAFRDMLQMLHSKVNVCILDEVFDVGLDTLGVEAAASMIKLRALEEGVGMYVISHRDEIEQSFEKKIIVENKDGFSYIREE